MLLSFGDWDYFLLRITANLITTVSYCLISTVLIWLVCRGDYLFPRAPLQLLLLLVILSYFTYLTSIINTSSPPNLLFLLIFIFTPIFATLALMKTLHSIALLQGLSSTATLPQAGAEDTPSKLISKSPLEIQTLNQRLQRQIELEKMATQISRMFIKVSPEDIEQKINYSLQSLANFLQADRAALILFEEGNFLPRAQFLYGYEDKSFANLKLNMAAFLNDNVLEQTRDVGVLNGVTEVEIDDLKVTAIPLVTEKTWGCLMLESENKKRLWREEEKNFLVLIADILAKGIDSFRCREKLKKCNLELQNSNQELEQFVYIASHDLQEPLRVVSSFCEILAEEYGDKFDEEGRQYLGFVIKSSQRMKELIKDLLALSRIHTRAREFTPVDCNEVLQEALENLKIAIAEKNAQVKAEKLPTVMADRFQLIQLWQNLVSNAIKFNRSPIPIVEITAESLEGEWRFCVADNGIGIAPEFRERIFIIFQRLHSDMEFEGTGIGLAICRKIVTRHGGKIWVESEEGKGAKFYFTLPKHR
ncbi:MAG: ATP-binding protein [Geminocystis sp.]|nr:ATP-binding protein [Geminocystis sp.]MDW8463211.1 ATP-binding protein [Geminocystis sp.]